MEINYRSNSKNKKKRKHNELVPDEYINISDKFNIIRHLSNLEISKKYKTNKETVTRNYSISATDYFKSNNFPNTKIEIDNKLSYDEEIEKNIVEDYYRKKNNELFRQMFGI